MLKTLIRRCASAAQPRMRQSAGDAPRKLRWELFLTVPVAGFLLVSVHDPIVYGIQSSDWPAADGKIVKSEAKAVKAGSEEAHVPSLEFEYTVDGKLHRSSVISFRYWGSAPSLEETRRIMEEFRPGTTVPVYYHPSKPSVGVLRKGDTLSPEAVAVAMTAVGLASFGAAIGPFGGAAVGVAWVLAAQGVRYYLRSNAP